VKPLALFEVRIQWIPDGALFFVLSILFCRGSCPCYGKQRLSGHGISDRCNEIETLVSDRVLYAAEKQALITSPHAQGEDNVSPTSFVLPSLPQSLKKEFLPMIRAHVN